MTKDIKIFPNLKSLSEAVADEWCDGANRALKEKVTFCVALSGGNTAPAVYRNLVDLQLGKRISWSVVHIFWGDERCVPPDHPESNYRLACDSMLISLPLPWENIHRIHGESDPQTEANRYADELAKHLKPDKEGMPYLDWVLVGVGKDGHIASIFPKSFHQEKTGKLCVVSVHPETGQNRISLTLPMINKAKRISVIATGKEKAGIVSKILSQSSEASHLPAAQIHPENGRVQWMLDMEAASKLNCRVSKKETSRN